MDLLEQTELFCEWASVLTCMNGECVIPWAQETHGHCSYSPDPVPHVQLPLSLSTISVLAHGGPFHGAMTAVPNRTEIPVRWIYKEPA